MRFSPGTYFGLGLLEPEPTFGESGPARPSFGQVLLVIVMYLGVLLGVLGDYGLEWARTAQEGLATTLQPLDLMQGWLVATIVFPLVFPRIFGPMEDDATLMAGWGRIGVHILQFFIAFQNGFFWQAVLYS